MRFTDTTNKQDYAACSKILRYINRFSTVVNGLINHALVILILGILAWLSYKKPEAVIFAVLCVLVTSGCLYLRRLKMLQAIQKKQMQDLTERTIELDDSGIRITRCDETQSTYYAWQRIEKILLTNNFFILGLKNHTSLFFNKRDCATCPEMAAFIQNHCPNIPTQIIHR